MTTRPGVRRRIPSRAGFTLLEVLVAITILGIGVSAVLSSQWVSFAWVTHARRESEAVGLVRCKMSEVEFELERDGMPITDQEETGPCCDGENFGNMTCSWTVSKPEFPEASFGELNLDSELSLGSQSGPSVLGSPAGVGAAGFLGAGQGAMSRQTGDASDVADSFMGDGEGVDGISALVMQIIYPDLKGIFEAGTRKVTVRISWFEGSKEYSIELEQWVTSAKDAGLFANVNGLLPEDEEEDASGSGTGSGSTSGSGSSKDSKSKSSDKTKTGGTTR